MTCLHTITDFVEHRTLVERIGTEETIDVARAQIGHHLWWRHHADLHIGVGVDAVFGQVVAQQEVVHRVIKRHAKLEAFPVLGVAVVFVLQAQCNCLAIDVLNGGHIHGRGIGTQPHADGQWHGRQKVRRVIFLVDHLVANQCPTRRFGHLHIQALLAVEAQGVRHDERGGAGDRDEPDLEVGFFEGGFFLRHGLQAGDRQHAGNGGHGGFLAHCAQKISTLLVLWKQGLDQGRFDELLAVGFKFCSL